MPRGGCGWLGLRRARLSPSAGLKPTSGVGKSDPHWNWVIAMDAKCPGFAAVVDKVKAKYPSVKPVSVHKWTGTIITANKKELGISQKRLI